MQFLRKILDFYIFSNIHVALSGFCLTKITLLKFGIQSNLTPFFVAFSVLISYNFIRFFEIKTNRLNWFKQWFFVHKSGLLLVSILSSIFLAYIIFFSSFNIKAILILFPFVFVTFFYVVPIFKKEKFELSFRNYPSIKIFSIAVSWAGVTVFFPLFEFGYSFTSNVYIEFVQRLFILIAIIVPFDIRDVTVDPKILKTLPQELGINKSKIVGYVLLLLFVILEVIQRNYFNSKIAISIIIAFITALFLGFSTPKRTRYYTSFWVEAIPIFWFVLIALFL